MIKRTRREQTVKLTPEAMALREIRISCGLSMREVCKRMGRSEGFLRHIETGRRDVPSKDVLELILNQYGVSYRKFLALVKKIMDRDSSLSPMEEIISSLDKLTQDNLKSVLALVKALKTN